MSTSPILPLRPLSPDDKKSAHRNHLQRRLSAPSSQTPPSRTQSPSYGAPSTWEDNISVPSSHRRRNKKSGWETYRRTASFGVVLLFLVGMLSVPLLSDPDGEGSALKRWWNHEGRKGTHQTFPSHAHIRELASIDSDILSLADPSRRLIIVGDIHGSIRPLKALLSKLKYDAKADTLLHVGDLVAKGPEPLEVLALLRKYNVQGVRGNHDQPVIEWRSWMEKSGYSFAEIGKWDEATAKRKVGYLPDNGRKWEGEHWQIALSMKPEDYQYLLSLPLVLHLPSLSTHLVHAGLLPSDPTLPPSSPPPAWQLPSSSSLAPLNQTQRETLLLTSVKQNTLPYDVMNMRSIDEEGEVTKETIDGEGWSERWNEAMEECRVWGGAKKGEGEGFKKKGKNGGKKPKKPKHEIECQPISVIYGHAAGRGLDLKPHSFGLDSGCVYGRELSALVLGDLRGLDGWKHGEVVKVTLLGGGKKNEGRVVGLECELGEVEGEDAFDL